MHNPRFDFYPVLCYRQVSTNFRPQSLPTPFPPPIINPMTTHYPDRHGDTSTPVRWTVVAQWVDDHDPKDRWTTTYSFATEQGAKDFNDRQLGRSYLGSHCIASTLGDIHPSTHQRDDMTTYHLYVANMQEKFRKHEPHDRQYDSLDSALAAVKDLHLPPMYAVTIHKIESDSVVRWYGVNMQTMTISSTGPVRPDTDQAVAR